MAKELSVASNPLGDIVNPKEILSSGLWIAAAETRSKHSALDIILTLMEETNILQDAFLSQTFLAQLFLNFPPSRLHRSEFREKLTEWKLKTIPSNLFFSCYCRTTIDNSHCFMHLPSAANTSRVKIFEPEHFVVACIEIPKTETFLTLRASTAQDRRKCCRLVQMLML